MGLTFASITVDLPGFGPTTFSAPRIPAHDLPYPAASPIGVTRGSFRIHWSKRDAKQLRRFICAVMAKASHRSYKRRLTAR